MKPQADETTKPQQQSVKKQEKKEEGGLTHQTVVAELAGLGMFAHLAEMGELDTQGQPVQSTDSLAINPKDQLNPSKAYKPR